MNIAQPVPSNVQSISFSFLTTEDIRRISVKQIVNPQLLDDLNRPTIGGLYDPSLGPSDRKDLCATCQLTYFTCPGHFGHIELPSPVFHPLFMVTMYKLLKGTCMYCHRFKIPRVQMLKYVGKLRLLDHGLLDLANAVDDMKPNIISNSNNTNGEAEETVEDYSTEEFAKRINLLVALSLRGNPQSKRDHYKDGLVYQARKEVIAEFLAATALKKCQNNDCGAFAHSLRKEGFTKIVELDLAVKQKTQHELMNLRRDNVLYQERQGRTDDAEFGDESASEESEGKGEATFSGEDEVEVQKKRNALPKSASGRVKSMRGRNERVIPPEECRAHLRRLFANEMPICSLIFGRHGPFADVNSDRLSIASADIFFIEGILVPPTRFRPPAKMGDTLFEHPHNELLARVLSTSYNLRDQVAALRQASEKDSTIDEVSRRRMLGRLLESLVQLQVDVNSFIDSSKNPQRMRQGKLPPAGVKQNLEKKEGLFRMNMMGKRVNYAARSVISPDVNIDTNEIGVPPVFARKLTFPEPVTEHNVHIMRDLVTNGPYKYPGASIVELEDGTKLSLETMNAEERRALANRLLTPQSDVLTARMGLSTKTPTINKKVYRHLRDGDVLILNRQPTLHKPSMMVHKAKVLQGEKTIRMHYANCNSYNADFDGDEMNIHFPLSSSENELARSEAMFIANTDNQYLVPTSGKPLRGLIQDHVVAGVWMTSRDTFFTREEYFQLLYGSLRPEEQDNSRLRTLPPTTWKPKVLWTGKQIVSTILLNVTPPKARGLNLTSKTKVSGDLWGKGSEEGKVVFMDGELLCGILDKSQFGATDYGLVHSCYELYGADVAGKLLGILSRLFTKFLQHRAFTCRMDDLTLTPNGDAGRRSLLEKAKTLGQEGAEENFPSLASLPPSERKGALRVFLRDVLRDDSKMAGLDVTVKKKLAGLTKSIADTCIPHGLSRKFPHNHMQLMTQSGAKGSAVNAQQISCALGQQELEGRRVPVMVSGKTLPSFKAFETAAIAGGYVASRFLTGVKPQEFYFHCMAGREGLIDTAVKTSRSGYLQRCLIKHLEGIRVHYDNTVRASDASILQFHYGGDALDVTKQKHLYQFEFYARNEKSLLARFNVPDPSKFNFGDASRHMKNSLKYLRNPEKGQRLDPAMSVYNPSRTVGATSEKFAQKVEEFIKTNPDHLIKDKGKDGKIPPWLSSHRNRVSQKHFRILMNFKYMRSMVDPGEAVGLLASQGVGEPSTQMTLNTFHFAGHGAANVTLGIPRLREIVMTASTKPKTPSMTIWVHPDADKKIVQSFCKRASRLTLSQLVDKVEVNEKLTRTRRRQFTVGISFYPKDEYREEYDVEPKEILSAFSINFPQILKREIQLELKKLQADLKGHLSEIGQGRSEARAGENGGNDEDANVETPEIDDNMSEVGDGNADDEKRTRQSRQQVTYESDDEGEESPSEEFDDDALEAEFEDSSETFGNKANAMDVDVADNTTENIEESQLVKTRQKFFDNLRSSTSFNFSESGVRFDLEFAADTPKLLLVGIVEKACQKTIVREIGGISDVFLSMNEGKDKRSKIVTNGSNLQGLWAFAQRFGVPVVEMNDVYTNDIYAGLITYGVEMARALILKEIQNVFSAYNIDVDIRHLELIADYMTFDGGYKPFNRKGIATNVSPLLKASFETTAAFISDATLHGDFDDLTTPSGNIVLGRPSQSGTGSFDIVQALPLANESSF